MTTYKCNKCDLEVDLYKVNGKIICEKCSQPMSILWNGRTHYKGSGYYKTDYTTEGITKRYMESDLDEEQAKMDGIDQSSDLLRPEEI